MSALVSSELKGDYLLVTGAGEVISANEYQISEEQYLNEILQYDESNIIIDETKMHYAPSLFLQSEIVDFYSTDMPEVLKEWKVAVVLLEDYLFFGEFWAHRANLAGYNYQVFVNMEDAGEFIKSLIKTYKKCINVGVSLRCASFHASHAVRYILFWPKAGLIKEIINFQQYPRGEVIMKKVFAGISLVMSLLMVTPASAHHSFAAQYDSNKPESLTGMVTKVEWQNPHVYLYIDVANEQGDYEQWALEMGAPAVLTRTQGWSRSFLQVGDEIQVEGRRARDGSRLVNARNVTLTSGETLGTGSSENTTP